MSSEWPRLTVAELEEQGIILVVDGNHGQYRPLPHEFGEGRYAYIRATDMDAGLVLFDAAARINDTAFNRIRKGVGAPGDVLFSHKGTVGKLALVPMDAPLYVCSPQTTLWRTLNEKKLDRRYLYCYMRSQEFIEQWFARKGETDMADYVSLTAQRELTVALPSLPEQRAIARVLGGLDDKIELNRRMNRTLEDLARGLFRSWFVDFEPVTKNGSTKASAAPYDVFPKRLVDSALGPIPEGWRAGSVADLARYVNGRNFTKDATGTGRMVARIAELNSGPGLSTVYNDVKAEPENVVQPGDLLFAWSGSLDVYRWNRDEALVNQHIFKVVCEAYPQWFVHLHLCEAMPFFQGIAADKATTMGHIKREHLRQAELALPPEPVLKYATQRIAPIYARLLANERESLRLAATRDALLPQLLSGEVRLAGASKSVEEIVA
jgi:type I restriction enzyme S subunit